MSDAATVRLREYDDGSYLDLDYILDPEESCNGFRREQGEPTAEHWRVDRFSPGDLVSMYDYAECPLHVNPDYALAPEGVWKRQYHLACVELDRLTTQHTGEDRDGIRFVCPDDGCTGCVDIVTTYHATRAELRDVFDRFPHARWALEQDAERGRVNITVVGD